MHIIILSYYHIISIKTKQNKEQTNNQEEIFTHHIYYLF